MTKITVATIVAGILTSGLMADGLNLDKATPNYTLGVGGSSISSGAVAGLFEIDTKNEKSLNSVYLLHDIEIDKNYASISGKSVYQNGSHGVFGGLGYLKADKKGEIKEGAFGVVGFSETLPIGLVDTTFEAGYKFGNETKGFVSELNVRNIVAQGGGLSLRYDNIDGFDRVAAYATVNF